MTDATQSAMPKRSDLPTRSASVMSSTYRTLTNFCNCFTRFTCAQCFRTHLGATRVANGLLCLA